MKRSVMTAVASVAAVAVLLAGGTAFAGNGKGNPQAASVNCKKNPTHPSCVSPTPTPTPTPTATPTNPPEALCSHDNADFEWFANENGSGTLGKYAVTEGELAPASTGFYQTTRFCDFGFISGAFAPSVPASADDSIKSYPSARVSYGEVLASSLPSLSASLAHATQPSCTGCAYEWVLDIRLNSNAVQLSVWTEHNGVGQTAPWVENTVIDGRRYDVYQDGNHITFVPVTPVVRGTFNVKAFIEYTGDVSARVSSVAYGVEVRSTGGTGRTFDMTRFALTP